MTDKQLAFGLLSETPKRQIEEPEEDLFVIKPPSHAEEKAAKYAAQLVAEGWPQLVAEQRARACYGLVSRAPDYRPKNISREYMKTVRDDYATERPGAGSLRETTAHAEIDWRRMKAKRSD